VKIGILGGTFNPVHLGHLILAEECREKLGLEKIIFMPAYLPPHKDPGEVAGAKERYYMLRSALKANPGFDLSDIEMKRKGRSYTIDTLRQLKREYPEDEIYFITGSDLLNYLEEWKDLDEIVGMVEFVVASRPGYPLEKIPRHIRTLDIRSVDISAFEIRRRIREGKSFRYLVSEPVFNYISRKGLYR
jgi:nicotinate-nucleotide adenylyltransferase